MKALTMAKTVKVPSDEFYLKILVTHSKMKIERHAYFFGCKCGSIQLIKEDQFFCKENIMCEKCELVIKAEWEWKRIQHIIGD